jgi:putative FmdB family regulatory protein
MPTYEYRCAKCGEELEVFQTFAEAPLTKHQHCGGKLAKVLSPAGIVLKGSGFYKTDNRSSKRSGGSESRNSESGGPSKTGDTNGSDSSRSGGDSSSSGSGGSGDSNKDSSSGSGAGSAGSSSGGSGDSKKPAAKSA